MPYKHNDPWFRKFRAFMKERADYLDDKTYKNYQKCLFASGQVLDWKDPLDVTLPEMKALEVKLSGNESTRGHVCTVTKIFLSWAENRDARKWKIAPKIRPKVDGVFFSESEVAQIRVVARGLGPELELLFSLGGDNGLRPEDMLNLTVEQATELLSTLSGTIIGKGRAGGKTGHLELSKMTVLSLRQYLEWRSKEVQKKGMDCPQLLIWSYGKKIGAMKYGTLLKRLTLLSDVSGLYFRPKDLRRTYGHRLHLAKRPIETIAFMMRHETINQSFRSYIGVQSDEARAAQDALGVP